MASNNPDELRRNGSARRSNTLLLPATPQPSARTPLRLSWDTHSTYQAVNSTSYRSNSSRSSFGSSTPLLRRQQSTPSARTSFVQSRSTELRPITPPVASHPTAASQPVTSQGTAAQTTANQPVGIQSETIQLTVAEPAPVAANPAAGDPPAPNPPAVRNTWKEWRSWKIEWPWLSFLLFTVVSLISAVAALDVVSRRNSGFVQQGNPPTFFVHNPALERAIWAQGIFYTAFPAFIMTLYRTMWDSAVTAFADRQPYIDLKKGGGRPPRCTIMLDYKAKPFLYSWLTALRNKHFLLAACMFTSAVLALLIVPLTSFLFTTASITSNTTIPISFETSFNSNVLGDYPNYPDLRLSLDSAAAMYVQDAPHPPWTDGEYAVAKFAPLVDLGEGTVTLETTAYSVRSDCIYIPESKYQKSILTPDETGIPALSIRITADDRGCQVSDFINLQLNREYKDTILRIWPTTSCDPDAGWSRFSILTAVYTHASISVTNVSLISCAPSYWMTPGTLVATTNSISPPSLRAFAPHQSNMSQFRPAALWRFFETELQSAGCYNPPGTVNSNEFGRLLYKVASKKNPASPLLPEAIIDAAQTLFTAAFAVFTSTDVFKPTSSPLNSIGVHSVDETRLIVVSPVAYIILGALIAAAILNIFLFFHARQESMLYEEPVGLLSMAGILHNSDLNTMVKKLVQEPNFNGKTVEAAMKEDNLNQQRYYYNERDKRIVNLGDRTLS